MRVNTVTHPKHSKISLVLVINGQSKTDYQESFYQRARGSTSTGTLPAGGGGNQVFSDMIRMAKAGCVGSHAKKGLTSETRIFSPLVLEYEATELGEATNGDDGEHKGPGFSHGASVRSAPCAW